MAHFEWPNNIDPVERLKAEGLIKDFIGSAAGQVFALNVHRACRQWEEEVSSIQSTGDANISHLCRLNGIFEVFRELRDKHLGLVDKD